MATMGPDPFGFQANQNFQLGQRVSNASLQADLAEQIARRRAARQQASGQPSQQSQANVEQLQRERELMLQRNQQQGQFYDTDPQAQRLGGFFQEQPFQSLMSMLQGRASGADAPYTPGVINAQLGREQDAAAGQVAGQSDMIRRRMANAGMGGSGQELSGLSNVRRQAGAGLRAASRDINSRATLANFQAREQAQGQLGANLFGQQSALERLVAQRNASQQVATQNELKIRGDAQVTQQV